MIPRVPSVTTELSPGELNKIAFLRYQYNTEHEKIQLIKIGFTV